MPPEALNDFCGFRSQPSPLPNLERGGVRSDGFEACGWLGFLRDLRFAAKIFDNLVGRNLEPRKFEFN